MLMNTTCSCGNTEAHTVMKRTSADGVTVLMWENGAITGKLGIGLAGVVLARPKTAEAVSRELRASHRFMELVPLYNVAELGSIYAAARKEEKIRAKAGI